MLYGGLEWSSGEEVSSRFVSTFHIPIDFANCTVTFCPTSHALHMEDVDYRFNPLSELNNDSAGRSAAAGSGLKTSSCTR